MLASQYACFTKHSSHPCHDVVFKSPDTPRNIKRSLSQFYKDESKEFGFDQTTSIKEIHTAYVQKAIENFPVNRNLNDQPPVGSLTVDSREKPGKKGPSDNCTTTKCFLQQHGRIPP